MTNVQISSSDLGLRELFPLFCGCEDCEGGHTYGPAVRDHYLIHYVRSGRGRFSFAGREYALSAGQCFLICPGEITVYTADAEDPWRYTWLAFSGERAPAFLRSAGLGPGNPVVAGAAVASFFEDLHGRILNGSVGGNDFSMISLLYAFFAALPHEKEAPPQKETYVGKARNYVAKMYQNPVSVGRLAAYCGLDRHYLCRIFKAETGLTPQAYILGFRMRRARELLLTSSLSVGDVARSVGYTDVYNFSRMFKKKYGSSPLRLRQEAPPSRDGGAGKERDQSL